MRINSFELTRYGKFTDAAIDFGAASPGEPDFHVIYGANEAGKSTLSCAIADLLFGMHPQTGYNFLHPYPTMRVSGTLETRHGPTRFVRLKKKDNSLLDGAGSPVPEALIRAELGELERQAYCMMFCLDEKTLAEGGQGILESKGDLGKLLFAASAGLEDLHKRLAGVREAADQFARTRRSGRLHELKQRADDLKTERDKLDTFSSEYSRLVQIRADADAEYEAALQAETALKAQLRRAQSLLQLLPRLTDIDLLEQDLAKRQSLPIVSRAMADELQALHTTAVQHEVAWTRNQRDIADAAQSLDALRPDEARLRLIGDIGEIERMRIRFEGAMTDVDKLVQRNATALATIKSLLAMLDKGDEADPARLLAPARVVGELRQLSEQRSGIDQALKTAGDEAAKSKDAHARATRALLALDARDQAPTSTLRQLVLTLKDRAYEHRLAEAQKTLARTRSQLADGLLKLSPWSGSVDELLALPCPALATIQRWRTELEKREAEARQLNESCKQKNADLAREQAQHKRLQQGAGAIDDDAAALTRQQRDAAWATHRAQLTVDTGDAFEQAMHADDDIGGRRFAYVSQVTELRSLRARLDTLSWELDQARNASVDAARERADFKDAFLATFPSALRAFPATDLERWVQLRDSAIALHDSARGAEHDLAGIVQDVEQANVQLRDAMTASRIQHAGDASLGDLIQSASDAIRQGDDIARIRETIADRAAEVESRDAAYVTAKALDADWNERWAAACKGCWFADGGSIPSVAIVREYLAVLEKLRPELDAQRDLAGRIRAMQKDQADFRSKLEEIGPAVCVAPRDDTLTFGAEVLAALRGEAANAQTRQALTGQLSSLSDEEARLETEANDIGARVAIWTRMFGAGSLADVLKLLPDAERKRDDLARLEELQRSVLVDFALASLDEGRALVRDLDRADVESEEAALTSRLEGQTQRTRDLFADLSRAQDRLADIGGDSAVAELTERRRTVLLEIEDGAIEYLKLSAGALAAEMALRSYREQHRSSMLTIASEAFSAVTCGAYSGLTTQPSKDRDILIANEAGGGSKSADALSTGARAQLYLALRIAGYNEYVGSRSPVPFIADDIMETFDDFRAAEAIRLLSRMSRSGQVIYLTHHQHLCDIVRDVAPEAKIHRLC